MSKIKIGVHVTAKVRHTNVAVSGTFQGYELEDPEDPTSGCGKVLYVKDGMMHLDRVYIDSIKIKVCERDDERIRKHIIEILERLSPCHWDGNEKSECIAYLKRPAEWSEEDELKLRLCIDALDVGQTRRHIYEQGITPGELIAWLKSLRPQPKQEWSEEEEKDIQKASEYLRDYANNYVQGGNSKLYVQSLADRIESLRPQTQWKPSKEQMVWLESAVKLSTDKPYIHGTIISLYEQLKRL